MGSIEGVIILSSTNEPILNSHFVHPLANYPSLHADRLVERLEASSYEKEKVGNSSKDVLPVVFVDNIPTVQEEETDVDEEYEEDIQERRELLKSVYDTVIHTTPEVNLSGQEEAFPSGSF